MWLLSFLIGCAPDTMLHYDKIEEIIIEEVTEEIVAEDIWVDSFYQPITLNGFDIIWVIDGSGSMTDDKERLLLGIEAMMGNLPESGWRLVMISTDEDAALNEEQFPLVPGDTYVEAEDMYNQIIRGHKEAGFDAVYSYVDLGVYSSTWMRRDAGLLVVFVSDEEEQSKTLLQVDDFIDWVERERNNVYVSSIVNVPSDESLCAAPISWVGDRYIEATEYFGGAVIDICSEDWTAGVADASAQIEPKEFIPLTYEPLSHENIKVFVDGKTFVDWHYNEIENTVYFDIIPGEGTLVEIAYYYDGDTAI